jgi:hypothetical protein
MEPLIPFLARSRMEIGRTELAKATARETM